MLGLASSQLMGCHGVLRSGGMLVGVGRVGIRRKQRVGMPPHANIDMPLPIFALQPSSWATRSLGSLGIQLLVGGARCVWAGASQGSVFFLAHV